MQQLKFLRGKLNVHRCAASQIAAGPVETRDKSDRDRRRWLILVPFALGVAATPLLARFAPARYRSEALIMVIPQRVPDNYVKPTVSEGRMLNSSLPSAAPSACRNTSTNGESADEAFEMAV